VHDLEGITDGAFGRQRDGVNNPAILGPLDLIDFSCLLLNREVLVDNPDATLAGQTDRQSRFGNRIHSCRDNRDIELESGSDPGDNVHLPWQHVRV